ncbi:hypothetical protein VNI00_009149 [Paramarasmius palmivorus]|uniref:AB hydrolase-1 domain-containing protein n=1 Tax=Paramarasmius palmivorus TaxID=297713 RepID=A0AAW0CP70_9AGAR
MSFDTSRTVQFGDHKLRRFNLVTFDLRGHGETSGDKMPPNYGQKESAEDVVKLMEALKLPACHIVGMSLGSIIALQMAISYPEKVASLFLISPLGLEEPDYVTAARVEIYDYWTQGFGDATNSKVDDAALLDALYGAMQFGFSNKTTSLTNAYAKRFLPLAKKIWGPNNFDLFHTATVDFFTKRKAHSKEALQSIAQRGVKMMLVHGLDDIPYPLEYSVEQEKIFKDAGIDVTLAKVKHAAHFVVADYGKEVNHVLHDFLLQSIKPAGKAVPPIPNSENILSPWDAALRKAGWRPEDVIDSDDDEEDDATSATS